ncbi:hypothetical protein AY601_2009 [Pedobacter cryoconitis]|uniref:Uncharacterized protein n=1 Tax=Pedobacter cryoconitis TaxID=188932 RepID=A0A127VC78_9SPHI|nr:hypothetical protein AY601_2009 [Pedobacter cryoconitis]
MNSENLKWLVDFPDKITPNSTDGESFLCTKKVMTMNFSASFSTGPGMMNPWLYKWMKS